MSKLIHLITAILLLLVEVNGLVESERMKEYHRRGHNWPPRSEDYTPNTPGWQKISERRISQLLNIEDDGESYDGYMVAAHTALNCKNFTENGWGLTRAPQHIMDLLLESLHNGLEEQVLHPTLEQRTSVIETDLQPYFIQQPQLNDHIVK